MINRVKSIDKLSIKGRFYDNKLQYFHNVKLYQNDVDYQFLFHLSQVAIITLCRINLRKQSCFTLI